MNHTIEQANKREEYDALSDVYQRESYTWEEGDPDWNDNSFELIKNRLYEYAQNHHVYCFLSMSCENPIPFLLRKRGLWYQFSKDTGAKPLTSLYTTKQLGEEMYYYGVAEVDISDIIQWRNSGNCYSEARYILFTKEIQDLEELTEYFYVNESETVVSAERNITFKSVKLTVDYIKLIEKKCMDGDATFFYEHTYYGEDENGDYTGEDYTEDFIFIHK